MRVAVAFQNERLELDVADERLIGHWSGPEAATGPARDVRRLVLDALESPRDFPPLRQAVVPGDRVVIACAPDLPDASSVLGAFCEVLRGAGVEAGAITVLVPEGPTDILTLPPGLRLVRHDPADATGIAYLASTGQGRRVYLNRELTDADFVLPVGEVGVDPVLGYRGPWSVVFPGLSNQETQQTLQREAAHGGDLSRVIDEALDVSWLLGCQLQLGLVTDLSGVAQAVAGQGAAVRAETVRAVDQLWSFQAEARAELVVVGIGPPDRPARIEDLAQGLDAATRLVERGGKIVALSRADGAIGPGLQRLIAAGDTRDPAAALRGHEADHDYRAARQIADALIRADVYVLSSLDVDRLENLSWIALDRPEEACRLVAASRSCLLVSHAERVRARAADE